GGRVEGDGVFDSGRKPLRQALEFRLGSLVDGKRIGTRELSDAETDGVVAVESKIGAVVFGAEFCAADIAKADEAAVCAGLQNDVFKFGWLDKTSDGANADLIALPGFRGRLAHLSCRDLNILLVEGAEN